MTRDRWMVGPSIYVVVLMLAAVGTPAAEPQERDVPVARFAWTGDHPPPLALRVVPSSADFGAAVAVVFDFAPGATLPGADELRVDVNWLAAAPGATLPDLAGLPEATGPRLVVPWRIYHLGTWRAAWDDGAPGAALTVQGQLPAPGEIMPVRDPRLPGGVPRWLLWLLAGATIAAVALWLRRRLRARARYRIPADLPLSPPAWLQTATQLRSLVEEMGSGADGRRFLDRLAGILRGYVGERFRLPATEMTAAEIAAAGRAAGWPAGQVDGFCRLLASCDHLRYAPPAISALHCHAGLSTALDLIEEVRVQPVWTSVAPGRFAAAAAAWQDLRARYPRQSDGGKAAAC